MRPSRVASFPAALALASFAPLLSVVAACGGASSPTASNTASQTTSQIASRTAPTSPSESASKSASESASEYASAEDEALSVAHTVASVAEAIREWRDEPLSTHFSQEERKELFTSRTRDLGNGKSLALSKAPLTFEYRSSDAPRAIYDTFGAFTAASELKAYMHLGAKPGEKARARFLRSFERLSQWNTILDATGSPVFVDAYATDGEGVKIADRSDGKASSTGETHYATLFLASSLPVRKIEIPARLRIHQREGEIQVDLTNVRAIKVPLAGTLIEPRGLEMRLKAYPYRDGFLVHTAIAVNLLKLRDAMGPEELAGLTTSIYAWVKDRTVRPVTRAD